MAESRFGLLCPPERVDITYWNALNKGWRLFHLMHHFQTAMSSERNPLLATPSQCHANAQNLEGVRKDEKLGPLEISRSNRWAILAGIWTANFLGVRRAASR
jgi:hypothetical protein